MVDVDARTYLLCSTVGCKIKKSGYLISGSPTLLHVLLLFTVLHAIKFTTFASFVIPLPCGKTCFF